MFQTMTNEKLVQYFGQLVQTERKIMHEVLECILEIDTRKIYLEKAYPSLFAYLTQAFGYSESAAQRRINAARVLRELPEVGPKLESGALNLSQTSLLSQSVRLVEKQGAVVTLAQKAQILQKFESLTYQESQTVIETELGIKTDVADRTRFHSEGAVTITVTLTADQAHRWKQLQELVSHSATGNAEVMDYLASKEIERRTESKRASPKRSYASPNPRQIVPNVRKTILKLDGPTGCSHVDPETARRCGSREYLQIDHIQPVWAGGGREPSNLRLLCAKHNRWKYMRQTGTKIAPTSLQPSLVGSC